jgi:hypothetical protein
MLPLVTKKQLFLLPGKKSCCTGQPLNSKEQPAAGSASSITMIVTAARAVLLLPLLRGAGPMALMLLDKMMTHHDDCGSGCQLAAA